MTLDLNKPQDAKKYLITWVEAGWLDLERNGCPSIIDDGTDEELTKIAKQLFLYCDPRPSPGADSGFH